MELPLGWRLGRSQDNHKSLFYRDQWVARIQEDADFQQNVDSLLKNPPFKLYPAMYRFGDLALDDITDEKGYRELIKSNLITPEDAYAKCPAIKRWLQRNHLWVKQNPEVVFKDTHYECISGKWYMQSDASLVELPSKAHFVSTWAARVAYAKGEATLLQVAQYSWGAVLEVAGDLLQMIPAYKPEYTENIQAAVMQLLDYEPVITTFKSGDTGTYIPVYDVKPLSPTDRSRFVSLLSEVLTGSISGYSAHLSLTNAYSLRIQLENQRWETQGQAVYVPNLVKRQDKIEAKTSLAEARDYVQQNHLDMIAIGALPADSRKTSFKYRGNTYGLNLDSGKLFFIVSDDARYIPKDFDKWGTSKQKSYLKDDYDVLVDEWCRRTKAHRRLYFYLRHCEHLPAKKAWDIATAKHRKLSAAYARRKRAAARWTCFHANQTAKSCVIVMPNLEVIQWS